MRTLKPFDYFEPGTVKEVVQLLSTYGEKAQVLAGGIDLIPRMRKGMIKADYLVNIQKIPSLEYIEDNGAKGLQFGAMARLHSIENSQAIIKAAETAAGETKPITDLRSTAEYRKEMTRVLVRRALEKAIEKVKA